MRRSTATIEAYSVPCSPATIASTGPAFAPWTTTTGMRSAASTPAGTSIAPAAFWPRAAVAVPTVNVARSWAPAVMIGSITPRHTPVRIRGNMAGSFRRPYRPG